VFDTIGDVDADDEMIFFLGLHRSSVAIGTGLVDRETVSSTF
jgi:hypothetical protein